MGRRGRGAQIGANIEFLAQAVTDGLYNADLNFGVAALNGDMRWLQVEVRSPAGVGAYVILGRREILGVPYAIQTRGIFVDNALRVGIGTTSPASLLDVRNDATGQGLRYNPIGNQFFDLELRSHVGELVLYHQTFDEPSGSASQVGFLDGDFDFSALIGSAFPEADGFLNIYGEDGFMPNFQVRGNPDLMGDGTSNTRMFIRSSGFGGIGGEFSVLNNDGDETIELLGGGSGDAGTLTMFDSGGSALVELSEQVGSGRLRVINPVNNTAFFDVREDTSIGGGGRFTVGRNDSGSIGFWVDGNWADTESTRVAIIGNTTSMSFDTSVAGTASVALPTDAIWRFEILDEPGVASATNSASVVLTGGVDTILSRTITVPTSGYCVVIGTCQANPSHTTGTTSFANFGVSDVSTSLPSNQNVAFVVLSVAPSGTYRRPVTVHGTFSVNGGANTFYFIGQELSASWAVFDMQLTIMFFPTAYGTVTPTILARHGEGGDDNATQMLPMSGIDIQNEQMQALAFDQNRRASEAADYAQQMADMQAQLDQVLREQESLRNELRRASPPIENFGAVLGHNNAGSR